MRACCCELTRACVRTPARACVRAEKSVRAYVHVRACVGVRAFLLSCVSACMRVCVRSFECARLCVHACVHTCLLAWDSFDASTMRQCCYSITLHSVSKYLPAAPCRSCQALRAQGEAVAYALVSKTGTDSSQRQRTCVALRCAQHFQSSHLRMASSMLCA